MFEYKFYNRGLQWVDLLNKNLLSFLKRNRPVDRSSTSSAFGINSNLTNAPSPSNARGVKRNVAPSNNMSGIFTSKLCVIIKLLHLPYNASVTSSMGDSK